MSWYLSEEFDYVLKIFKGVSFQFARVFLKRPWQAALNSTHVINWCKIVALKENELTKGQLILKADWRAIDSPKK